METFNKREFNENTLDVYFVEDNELKLVKGILRGLHFQNKNFQDKLVRAIKGEIYNVAVDLRVGSPTYGKYEGLILTEENKRQLYIPKGFAHGILVLSDEAILNYKCTSFYSSQYNDGIRYDDSDLNINWPIDKNMKIILSDKDKKQKSFKELESPFIYEEDIVDNNITLKPIREKDIESIRIWRNEAAMKGVFIDSTLITVNQQIKWYYSYKNNNTDRMFMIKLNDKNIGTVALYNINNREKSAEFGRLLIGDIGSRGKGVGDKVTQMICGYGFNKLNLEKINLEVLKENKYAFNIYEKIGFKEYGKRKVLSNLFINNTNTDSKNNAREIIMMELLKSNNDK